jgi:polyadenylate-binding protein
MDFRLTVCEYVPRLNRPTLGKPLCSTNLYVKNFPTEEGCEFTEGQLRDLFIPFGELVSCVIMRDESGKSKQFGFVCFRQSQDAQKALDHFSAAKENAPDPASTHAYLYVCEAKTKEQRRLELEKSAYQFKRSMKLFNLIVRNVDPACTKEEFEDYFKNFGAIRSTKLVPEAGIGFVCFVDQESARNAKDNNNLFIRDRKLTAAFCEPKESRQKYLEETWDRRCYDKQKQSIYS